MSDETRTETSHKFFGCAVCTEHAVGRELVVFRGSKVESRSLGSPAGWWLRDGRYYCSTKCASTRPAPAPKAGVEAHMRGERVESKMTAPASESGAPLGCTDDPTGINEHEARALVVEHLAKFNHRLLEGTPFTYDHKTNEWHGIVVTSSNALVVAGFRMKKSDSASSVSSVERTAVTPATTHAGGNTP